MKKRIIIATVATLMCCLMPTTARANDGVFYVSGSQLVPLQETDIAVTKEVLTITLNDDGYADVDVQYVFTNHGPAKTVKMGFEAGAPYNTEDKPSANFQHPYIENFTVTMNGSKLGYDNAIVASNPNGVSDFVPLDLKVWKSGMAANDPSSSNFYNPANDSTIVFSYAYYFTAQFQAGENTVHHTYRYRTSSGIGRTFEVPYWLTPATRWANHQIDDFTLRIRAPKTAKYFFLSAGLFQGADFKLKEGFGKIRKTKYQYSNEIIEISLRNGTVEWHKRNFSPAENMCITSADANFSFDENFRLGAFYDRSDTYVPCMNPDIKLDREILRNLPYASRGYVFKKRKFQDYFSSLWWYIPDPLWEVSTDDFTPREWRLINKGE